MQFTVPTWVVRTEDLRLHSQVRDVRPGLLRWRGRIYHDLELRVGQFSVSVLGEGLENISTNIRVVL